MANTALVWIRDDFRLQDNPALSFATNNHEFVSAIYIYDKKNFDNIREAQKWWLSKSLENFKKDFPDSKFNDQGMFLKILSQYNIASNSFQNLQEDRFRDLIDLYLDFVDEYPSSTYRIEAEKMYLESLNILSNFATQKK